MPQLNSTPLLEMALDLANSITTEDRFDRLLTSIRKTIHCDAVVLLSYQHPLLTPLAIQGLSADTLGRRFNLDAHPRLKIICDAKRPVRFPSDTPLPDPYDGLLLAEYSDLPIHSCMGLPLYADQKLIGVVTIDSLNTNAFDTISDRTLELIAAMSAATLKAAMQLNTLEQSAKQANDLVQELTQQALLREGGELIGQSPAMMSLKSDIQLVAGTDFSVLIQGPTGVGKELVARTVHRSSSRAHQPLVQLNCASLTETLAESELFGHGKGAFTGADTDRSGKFQLADGGTIFLDEVGELPLSIQSKLLRVLQSGEIQPVGKDQVHSVNVRVIAATNRDLTKEVEQGRFRADLYHRLSVYPINVPPLNQRHRDVLLLAGFFLESTARKLAVRQLTLNIDAQQALVDYNWPGNVRELEHVISRASLKASKTSSSSDIITLTPEHLDLPVPAPHPVSVTPPSIETPLPLRMATDNFQRDYLLRALHQSQGNWSAAARLLDVDRGNLSRLAKRLGVTVNKTLNHSPQQKRARDDAG